MMANMMQIFTFGSFCLLNYFFCLKVVLYR